MQSFIYPLKASENRKVHWERERETETETETETERGRERHRYQINPFLAGDIKFVTLPHYVSITQSNLPRRIPR